ncbi:topoisomerase DNA-binding C4 zinc finger domain-containing protein [Paraglaciecola sp. MB-3u-78]|nr:topoisomerase DNA-binding C4 zinc finger domain-containing protein [Paraglaciecola sp. MB-3u-78]
MVQRIAKKGANLGNAFMGCSGFPKCRYIEQL